MRDRTVFSIGILAIVVAVVFVFGASFSYPFISLDDSLLIYQNEITWGISWKNIQAAFTTYDPELYIPLTFLSYQIDYALGEGVLWVYRVQHLFWYILNAVLVFLFLWQLSARRWLAVFGGLLYAVHPLNVEAAVWLSARKDLLSAAFFWLSILFYIRYVRLSKKSMLYWSIAFFALGLFAKVSIIVLPAVLLLIDVHEQRRWHASLLYEKIPYFLFAIVFGVVALLGKAAEPEATLFMQALLALKSISFYLQSFVWPVHLSVLYPALEPIVLSNLFYLVPIIFFATFCTLLWLVRRSRQLLFGLLFFLITLAPSFLNLSKGPDAYFASDRYVYIPMVGLLLCVLLAAMKMTKFQIPMAKKLFGHWSRIFWSLFLMMLILGYGLRSYTQVQVWSSNESLYRHVLTHYPNAYLAQVNLGNELRIARRFDEALEHYNRGIALNSTAPKAYYNRAQLYQEIGEIQAAIADYRLAIEHDERYALAMVNLGKLLADRGENVAAEEWYRRAQDVASDYALAYYNHGVLFADQKRFRESVPFFSKSIELASNHVPSYANLVWAHLALEDLENALAVLRDGLQLFPNDERLLSILSVLRERGIVE